MYKACKLQRSIFVFNTKTTNNWNIKFSSEIKSEITRETLQQYYSTEAFILFYEISQNTLFHVSKNFYTKMVNWLFRPFWYF